MSGINHYSVEILLVKVPLQLELPASFVLAALLSALILRKGKGKAPVSWFVFLRLAEKERNVSVQAMSSGKYRGGSMEKVDTGNE